MLGICRVCGSNQLDGDYESFLTLVESDKITPSNSGYLYEELMDLPVLADNMDNTEIFLCSSCDLQMKLFKKLKEKALRTMQAMQKYFLKIHNQEYFESTSSTMLETSKAEFSVEYLEDEDEELVVIQTKDDDDEENMYTDIEILEEALEDVTNDNNQDIDNDKHANKKKLAHSGYHCFCCQQHFNKRDDYRLHRIESHKNKYPCTECTKTFNTADALRVHLQLHRSDGKKYNCELCGSIFNQKAHLKYHIDRHNNIRSHICEVCEKAFLSKSDLNIHMRTHTGEKKYICSICGKKFLILQHLKMHYYSHTNEKEFLCDICNYRFISPVTLKVHQQNMHSAHQFECELCEKKFRSKKNLQVHYKVHENPSCRTICEEEVTEQLYELHSRVQEECVDDVAITEEVENINNLAGNLFIQGKDDFFY